MSGDLKNRLIESLKRFLRLPYDEEKSMLELEEEGRRRMRDQVAAQRSQEKHKDKE